MNDFRLSGKTIRKIEKLSGLRQLLSVEIKGQKDIIQTSWLFKGEFLSEDEIEKYKPKKGVRWKKKGVPVKKEETLSLDKLGIFRDNQGNIVSEVERKEIILDEKIKKLAESDSEFMELLEIRLKEDMVDSGNASKRETSIRFFIKNVKEARRNYIVYSSKKKIKRDIDLINTSDRFIFFLNELLNKERKVDVDSKGGSNPFPEIFNGDSNKPFELFSQYLEKYFIDPFIDFSFIYQQMKSDKYIINIKHRNFASWAYKNKYIGKKLFDEIYEKNSLRSLLKATSSQRLNNYNNLKKEIF